MFETMIISKETGILWKIETAEIIPATDHEHIKKMNPTIFWNDKECYYWAFDTQLPSGKWLEMIRPEPEKHIINAIIL